MVNIPKKLRHDLNEHTTIGTLELAVEMVSKDGTVKRAYRLWDGQLIESVLMPYDDGRNTACISSQAGCAMGCVFCATGQMGFARQLTPSEIFEQVARFSAELKSKDQRLTNIVLMGMGEPLANYRNVMEALRRVNVELGVGARRITVSTVGVVPSIRKLMEDDLQVKLAVSLHCAEDEERTALLPANGRYGGLDELMTAVREYIDVTKRRMTFEWALIEGQNDTPEVARSIGRLLKRFGIRKDMVHVNLIPLNPTGGFVGSPSAKGRVDEFVRVLGVEFGISATPRVRRGIDIEAGCGQLKAVVKKKEEREKLKAERQSKTEKGDEGKSAITERDLRSFFDKPQTVDEVVFDKPTLGLVDDIEERPANNDDSQQEQTMMPLASLPPKPIETPNQPIIINNFSIADDFVNLDDDDITNDDDDDEATNFNQREIDRLINLVKDTSLPPQTTLAPDVNLGSPPQIEIKQDDAVIETVEHEPILVGPTTTITDEASVRKSKGRKKKLLKNLRAIDKLKELEIIGKVLNQEQREKVAKETTWQLELESIEHNLQ